MRIFILIASIFLSANVSALSYGNAAWLYGKKTTWIQKISEMNNINYQFRYLIPEAAVVHVDAGNNRLVYRYDRSVTAFYKEKLPRVKVLPDFSFWVAKTSFMHWRKGDYVLAAKAIAADVNQDSNADGVFLDLENYKPVLLPFYKTLSLELKKSHKILSVIVRPGQENVEWFKALGDNAIVVLYGYDLHEAGDGDYPVSPRVYQKRLNAAFKHFIDVAVTSHTYAMGGLPAIATTYEWEKKIISPTKTLTNPYPMIDYTNAALAVYHNHATPFYLGHTLWAFVDTKKNFKELPVNISPTVWQNLLQEQRL